MLVYSSPFAARHKINVLVNSGISHAISRAYLRNSRCCSRSPCANAVTSSSSNSGSSTLSFSFIFSRPNFCFFCGTDAGRRRRCASVMFLFTMRAVALASSPCRIDSIVFSKRAHCASSGFREAAGAGSLGPLGVDSSKRGEEVVKLRRRGDCLLARPLWHLLAARRRLDAAADMAKRSSCN